MKAFIQSATRYAALFILSVVVLIACKDDDNPSGPEGALGKQFNLALGQVTSSLAYSIIASADGTKILATTTPTGGYYYSGDGGKTFNPMDNFYLRYATYIDNQGNILTSDKYLFINGAPGSISSFDQLILGDNGKIFSYNANSNTIKYKNVSSGDFVAIANPSTPGPGSGVYIMKAPGKGLLFLEVTGSGASANTTIKAYILDEATTLWSNVMTASVDFSKLNTCASALNRFEKYTYVGNNIIVAKGCTGSAIIDLATSNTTYLNFPDPENLIYTDIRDGQIFVDSKKQVYIVAGTYADLNRKFVYRYNGTSWSQLEGYFALSQMPVMTMDQSDNIYYNAGDGAGESIRGAVKVNVTTNIKTPLALPTEKLIVTDAAAVSDNTLLVIVENQLYEHDIAAGTTTKMSLSDVNHINLLSDRRLLAGGHDKLYLSSDDGESWAETKKIFSSVDATKDGASVSRSRIINGKIVMTGTYGYVYNNLSLGIAQNKFDNLAIEFNGTTSTKLSYTFPGDFEPAAIAADGTIYGTVTRILSTYQYASEAYELRLNVAPSPLTEFTTTPQVVTDSGLQMTILPDQSGALEIKTRGSSTEEWKSTNTPLPPIGSGSVKLRQSGDRLVVIHDSEVFVSGN